MTTLDERITADGVYVLNARRIEQPADRFDADWWAVDLSARHNRRFSIRFGMGTGHNGQQPTAHDILECVLSDASGIENADGFEDWTEEYGVDSDSRREERIYKATVEQTDLLRVFLGDDYDAYLWETDND